MKGCYLDEKLLVIVAGRQTKQKLGAVLMISIKMIEQVYNIVLYLNISKLVSLCSKHKNSNFFVR